MNRIKYDRVVVFLDGIAAPVCSVHLLDDDDHRHGDHARIC
jgi:hypothetical protein